MNDNFKFYEDENIEVYTSGAIFRKNDKQPAEIIKDIALRYRYLLDVLGLFFKEHKVDKDEFAEVCHKTFGYYRRYYKKLFDQILITQEEKEKEKENER